MKEVKEIMEEVLNEALITFNKKAYPKFGNVVILAGGSGSGKGFILSNLLGIEGNVFDVDELKKLAKATTMFSKKVKGETGVDIKKLSLKRSKNVSTLHKILAFDYGLTDKKLEATFKSMSLADKERKPNVIFDVTLKDITKLHNLTKALEDFGYQKKNIHLVWVVNDVTVAIKQNLGRDRVVPQDILLDTHEGASITMKKIIDMGSKIKKYMDGDIWLAFNKYGVDTEVAKSKIEPEEFSNLGLDNLRKEKGGSYIVSANFVKVKEAGKTGLKSDQISKEVIKKIQQYVPKLDSWK